MEASLLFKQAKVHSVALKLCPIISTLSAHTKSRNTNVMFSEFIHDIPSAWMSCSFPPVMEYQVQINSVKAKLQETRARKKQQEELIMKVENQALKVSSEHAYTFITQSFRN